MAKKKSGMRTVALLICFAVFLVSAFFLGKDLLTAHRERVANDELASQVDSAMSQISDTKYAADGLLVKYDKLWQQNHDMAGWLLIPDTVVNYPVMASPAGSPDYYLRRGFDGKYAHSGSLFMDEKCGVDSNHVIIYGHNMKNGVMFGDLTRYADADYAKAHSIIHFDTLRHERQYKVLAAFYSRVYEEDAQGVFRYYQYADLGDKAVFDEYLSQARAAALYDTGVAATYGDRLLTLSTCSYHTDDGRFVVVAVEVAE